MTSITNNLIIRADASTRMGTGHVMRCIALGQAWQDAGGNVSFVSCCDSDGIKKRIREEGFGLSELSGSYPESEEDISTTLDIAGQTGAAWVVVDGYHFDLTYQKALRAAGFKLLLMDDYNHHPQYECDLLLNQNINADKLAYRINSDAKLLLGTNYALLRREFSQGSKKKERVFPNIGTHVLVTLGGSDPDNVTLTVIEAFQDLNIPGLQAKIIVGPANPNRGILQDAIGSSESDIQRLDSVIDMPDLMRWADLVVSAGGSTCWELCRLGVPFMTLVLAENQSGLATELDRRGIAQCLGYSPAVEAIAEAVDELLSDHDARMRRSAAGRRLVGGFGVDRVLCLPAKESGLDLFKGRLALRPAAVCDMECFWKWANDLLVRKNCYHSAPISLEIHDAWFSGKLGSADTMMLVLELDGNAVGQIRYDRCGDRAVIGLSIDKYFRGLGLGHKIIELSLERALSELKISAVKAEVFQSNTSSQSAFLKTGFELVQTCEIKGVPSFVYERKLA